MQRVAIVGAGWAGLAAAVRSTQRGHRVTVFEMARHAGGRARGVRTGAGVLDNGQHILIGAYTHTLALMSQVGANPQHWLQRLPLSLIYPDGRGLRLPAGPPVTAFARGVLSATGWRWSDRCCLLAAAARWRLGGFRCAPSLTVGQLCRRLPRTLVRDLIEPLCVAALNTPMSKASAQVFLRVLHDALFSGHGSADLLLPRGSLTDVLPEPALTWLADRGASIHLGQRAMTLSPADPGWHLDGERFDTVILACSAVEAARLSASIAPDWSRVTAALRYEPIVTAYLLDPTLRLPAPMLALDADDAGAPAQFAFDLGALGRADATFAFVVSGASTWMERGLTATGQAVLRQARRAFPGAFNADGAMGDEAVIAHLTVEQRATFACTPGLARPPMQIAPGLLAAGDYVEGPYPATLEGAVRAGESAADAVSRPQ